MKTNMPGPVAPPTPYTVRPFAGASVVYDANGGAITGPINGKAAALLAAAPDLLAAARRVLGELQALGHPVVDPKAGSCAACALRDAIAKTEVY